MNDDNKTDLAFLAAMCACALSVASITMAVIL